MNKWDIHEARARLSKLINQAAKGEPFVMARAGKPPVKVTTFDTTAAPQRPGFLAGEIKVPDDLDTLGQREIATLFGIPE